MALTLVEAAKINSGDVVKSAVIEQYARSSDILRVLPFENISGNAIKYNQEGSLPGIGFRGVNEAYSESTGVLNPVTEPLVIAGGDLDVDNFIIETQGASVRSTHEMMKVKALALDHATYRMQVYVQQVGAAAFCYSKLTAVLVESAELQIWSC